MFCDLLRFSPSLKDVFSNTYIRHLVVEQSVAALPKKKKKNVARANFSCHQHFKSVPLISAYYIEKSIASEANFFFAKVLKVLCIPCIGMLLNYVTM